jgi:hypothetical protein
MDQAGAQKTVLWSMESGFGGLEEVLAPRVRPAHPRREWCRSAQE